MSGGYVNQLKYDLAIGSFNSSPSSREPSFNPTSPQKTYPI